MSGIRNHTSSVGACPNCGRGLSTADVLIEYGTSEGESERFADCPGCRDVVHPV